MSVLLAVVVAVVCSHHVFANENQTHADGMFLFTGLESVMKYFRRNQDPLAQKILFTFERECFYMSEPVIPSVDDPKRKPVIVIEGNYRPSRDILGMKLARLMDGRYLNNPAPCLIRYLQQLPTGSFLRRAYFVLSLYATDFNVRVQLSTGRPVIMNGCWLDQLTFSVIQTYGDNGGPPMSSDVFDWPPDLLQPDLTLYLTLPIADHQPVMGRPVSFWQNRSLTMYRELQSRYPIIIQNHKTKPETIHQIIVKNLANKRDVSVKDNEEGEPHYTMSLFSGLDQVFAYLRNHTNPLAQKMLETFQRDCVFKREPQLPTDNKRKPFIVIEGNGHTSRDIVGKALARKMNARYMVHPASCLVRFLDILPKGTVLRRAYYVLSLYATSNSVKAHLSTNKGVILNGYWLDQLTFSLIQSFRDDALPSSVSELFRLPEQLLMPDLIFYLHLRDDLRTMTSDSPQGPSWYTRALQLYESLQNLYPIVIENLIGNDRATGDNVYNQIRSRLSSTRAIVLQDYEEVPPVLNLFTGLQAVLDFFGNSTNPLSKDILSTFESQCVTKPPPVPVARKPFIVIEGNNRTSRDVVTTRLARNLGALSMKHPAPCLRGFMDSMPKGSLMRRAYYILSLYATSMDVMKQVAFSPVILNGYWLDQLTFVLIQSFQWGQLPPVSSDTFRWPDSLVQPDVIVYLDHPDHLEHHFPLTRSPRNWKPRALQLYRDLQDKFHIQIQELSEDYWETTDRIYQFISRTLYAQ